jgi:hypothetical protein
MEIVMPSPTLPPARALDRDFLDIRCRLIELAAAMDRIDRGGSVDGDPRLAQIRRSLEILSANAPNRAKQVLMAFSLPEEKRD